MENHIELQAVHIFYTAIQAFIRFSPNHCHKRNLTKKTSRKIVKISLVLWFYGMLINIFLAELQKTKTISGYGCCFFPLFLNCTLLSQNYREWAILEKEEEKNSIPFIECTFRHRLPTIKFELKLAKSVRRQKSAKIVNSIEHFVQKWNEKHENERFSITSIAFGATDVRIHKEALYFLVICLPSCISKRQLISTFLTIGYVLKTKVFASRKTTDIGQQCYWVISTIDQNTI